MTNGRRLNSKVRASKGTALASGSGPQSPRILLVDDEAIVIRCSKRLLEHAGYQVDSAVDGEAGLAVARRSPPDLLLTDVIMPGMGGIKLISEFRSLYPTTGCIAATQHADPDRIIELLRHGAHDVILRPCAHAELIGRIEIVLAKTSPNKAPGSDSRLPRVFIGSSSEGLLFAKAIQQELARCAEVTLWSQGSFRLMASALDSLCTELDRNDFAILLMTADDMLVSRGHRRPAARDNVLLEIGMFIGRFGCERTFVVVDKTSGVAIPSDLAGIALGTFQPHSTGNSRAAVGPVCTTIEEQIVRLGPRYRGEPPTASR